jgi:GNAT superfamily N-acetyltransferase
MSIESKPLPAFPASAGTRDRATRRGVTASSGTVGARRRERTMQPRLLPRQVLDWVALLERLHDEDRDGLRRHCLALGPEDRRLRFGVQVSDEFVDDYVAGIDFERDVVFGVCSGGGRWLGVGHLVPGDGDAELGLSVLSEARGKGLGAAIFRFAVAHAARRGVRRLFMHFLTRNRAILAIAQAARMQIRSEAGESDAHLIVPPYPEFVRMLIASTDPAHSAAGETRG